MPRNKMKPLGTDELINRAFKAVLEDEMRTRHKIDLPETVPDDARAVLRMVDYIVRQRVVEHAEREPHRSQTKPKNI